MASYSLCSLCGLLQSLTVSVVSYSLCSLLQPLQSLTVFVVSYNLIVPYSLFSHLQFYCVCNFSILEEMAIEFGVTISLLVWISNSSYWQDLSRLFLYSYLLLEESPLSNLQFSITEKSVCRRFSEVSFAFYNTFAKFLVTLDI